jgi:hypothetical protein
MRPAASSSSIKANRSQGRGAKPQGLGESATAGVVAERVLAVCKAICEPQKTTFDWNEEGRNINK